MVKIRQILAFMILPAFISCAGKTEYQKSVRQALDITKEHSVHAAKLDRPAIESDIINKAEDVRMDDDLFALLKALLDKLGDNHSFLLAAGGQRWGGKCITGSKILRT